MALERLAASIQEDGDAKNGAGAPWVRRLMATLAPVTPDIAERLARHYAAEVRLARGLAQDAASLVRYPHSRVRLLGAAERTRGRAQHIRRALEGSGQPVADPATRNGPIEPTVRDRLLASVSELSSMSEAYLMDAQAVEREDPGIAGLLYDLHRETAEDRRDLIWTLAQLPWTAAKTPTSHEEVPREVSESRLEEREGCRAMGYRTLDGVIGELKKRGFVERFDVRDGQLRALGSGRAFDAEDLTIRQYQRFEGVSNPDDSSIVYAIETRSGTKGLLMDAFGPYANSEVGRLLETVEMSGDAR